LVVLLAVSTFGAAQEEFRTLETPIGTIEIESGYPSKESVDKLYNVMDFQRACQAYIWGIPAVGIAEWDNANRKVIKARNGQWVSYLTFKEKLGILTPNFTTPYVCATVDLETSGPIVFEIPPGLMAGMVLDIWQRVLADMGVVGPDEGKGGKFLILSPGHEMVNRMVTMSIHHRHAQYSWDFDCSIVIVKKRFVSWFRKSSPTHSRRPDRERRCPSSGAVMWSGARCPRAGWRIGNV
jgi:hypothetical protein